MGMCSGCGCWTARALETSFRSFIIKFHTKIPLACSIRNHYTCLLANFSGSYGPSRIIHNIRSVQQPQQQRSEMVSLPLVAEYRTTHCIHTKYACRSNMKVSNKIEELAMEWNEQTKTPEIFCLCVFAYVDLRCHVVRRTFKWFTMP